MFTLVLLQYFKPIQKYPDQTRRRKERTVCKAHGTPLWQPNHLILNLWFTVTPAL